MCLITQTVPKEKTCNRAYPFGTVRAMTNPEGKAGSDVVMSAPGVRVERDLLTAREYLRVSEDRWKRKASNTQQHDENLVAAERHPFRVLVDQAYSDTVSASRYSKKERKDFAALLSDLKAGRFGADILQMWESSRGSRKVIEWCTLLDLCEARGVLIFVTTHGRMYDPRNARDRRSLLEDAIDSEYESAKIMLRTTRSSAGPSCRPRLGWSERSSG